MEDLGPGRPLAWKNSDQCLYLWAVLSKGEGEETFLILAIQWQRESRGKGRIQLCREHRKNHHPPGANRTPGSSSLPGLFLGIFFSHPGQDPSKKVQPGWRCSHCAGRAPGGESRCGNWERFWVQSAVLQHRHLCSRCSECSCAGTAHPQLGHSTSTARTDVILLSRVRVMSLPELCQQNAINSAMTHAYVWNELEFWPVSYLCHTSKCHHTAEFVFTIGFVQYSASVYKHILCKSSVNYPCSVFCVEYHFFNYRLHPRLSLHACCWANYHKFPCNN